MVIRPKVHNVRYFRFNQSIILQLEVSKVKILKNNHKFDNSTARVDQNTEEVFFCGRHMFSTENIYI